jgi:hypothetical protein
MVQGLMVGEIVFGARIISVTVFATAAVTKTVSDVRNDYPKFRNRLWSGVQVIGQLGFCVHVKI